MILKSAKKICRIITQKINIFLQCNSIDIEKLDLKDGDTVIIKISTKQDYEKSEVLYLASKLTRMLNKKKHNIDVLIVYEGISIELKSNQENQQ